MTSRGLFPPLRLEDLNRTDPTAPSYLAPRRELGGRLPDQKLPIPMPLQRQLARRGVQLSVYVEYLGKPVHGRQERRELWAWHEPELNAHLGEWGEAGAPWPHAVQVCWLRHERTLNGETTVTVTHAVTSLPPEKAGARRLLEESRGRFGSIENKSHHVRDVTLGEDASRVRKGAGPEVMAGIRNAALALMRRAGAENIAERLRTHAARYPEAVALLLDARGG